MKYFEVNIKSIETDINEPSEEWRVHSEKTWLCQRCGEPRPGSGPVDAIIKGKPVDSPVNFCGHVFVGVIRDDFLHVLEKDIVSSDLLLGKVSDVTGQNYPNFHTFVGKEDVFIRGNANSNHRICEICGRILYTAVKSRYLTPNQVQSNRLIYGNAGRLVIREDLRNRLDKKWDRELGIYPLPVLNVAKDGLRIDLSLFPSPEQMIDYKPNIWI